MLIPLGFLAASGVSAGSFDLLETQTLTGSASSVTFSSLSTYASTYQHLQIRFTARSGSGAGATLSSGLRFNSDTTSGNYRWHSLRGNGSNVASFDSSTSDRAAAGLVAGSTAASNVFGANVIDILDPFETTKNKTIRAIGGQGEVYLYSGAWFSTTAVSSISIFDIYGSSFQQYSRFSLYGIKGA
jgi:hypothetical protein